MSNLPQEVIYSHKLQNRLKTVYDRCELLLVDNDTTTCAKYKHIKTCFTGRCVPDRVDDVAIFNRMLPAIAERLLLVNQGARENCFIDRVGGADFLHTLDIGEMISTGSNGVIRLVYGATKEMPLRAVSYAASALSYLDNLSRVTDQLPQLQIIYPHHIATSLNGIDSALAFHNFEELIQATGSFVTQRFPHLMKNTTFLVDKLDEGFNKDNEVIKTKLRETLTEEQIVLLKGKGERNGNSDNSLYYAAAHVLLHDTSMEGRLHSLSNQLLPICPDFIVNIGGRQEEFFYHLRYTVKPSLPENFRQIPTMQLFTRHYVPPYYMAKGGDILLGSAAVDFNSQSLAKTARFDLEYLERIVSSRTGAPKLSEVLSRAV